MGVAEAAGASGVARVTRVARVVGVAGKVEVVVVWGSRASGIEWASAAVKGTCLLNY